jgi:hypothetical protein
MPAFRRIAPWGWMIFALLLLTVATHTWYSVVWMDEVMWTDPAANLLHGFGFTSTAWPSQRADEFWAGNAPLHSQLLYRWIRAFGFGVLQVRLFGYVLWSAAVAIICVAAQRAKWVRTDRGLAVLALLLFIGSGVTFNYRSGRYDPLAVLVVALGVLSFTVRAPGRRRAAIIASGALFMPAGLILGPVSVVFCAAGLVGLGWKRLADLLCVGVGLLVGFGGIYLFHAPHGTWQTFLHATSALTQTYFPPDAPTHPLLRKAARFVADLTRERSLFVVVISAAALARVAWPNLDATQRRLLAGAALVVVLMPVTLMTLYAFPIYYAWTAYIPASIAFVVAMETWCARSAGWKPRAVLALVLSAAFALGLGFRLGTAALAPGLRDYGRVEQFVQSAVHPGDVVFADYQAFYPLQTLRVRTYYSWYEKLFTPEESRRVNCLVINPTWLPFAQNLFGGTWRPTGESYRSGRGFDIAWLDRLLPRYFTQQTNLHYDLAIYRRDVE